MSDIREEHKFLTGYLETPSFNIKLKYRVTHKGKVLVEASAPAHSPTLNLYQSWFALVAERNLGDSGGFGASQLAVKDRGGTVRYNNSYGPHSYRVLNKPGLVTCGIAVGGGDTTYSFYDNKLASQFAHGSNTGQLYYHLAGVGDTCVPTWVSGSRVMRWEHKRDFTNLSSNAVVVKEAGLFRSLRYYSSWYWALLMMRDVISAPVTVPAAGLFHIEYLLETPTWPT